MPGAPDEATKRVLPFDVGFGVAARVGATRDRLEARPDHSRPVRHGSVGWAVGQGCPTDGSAPSRSGLRNGCCNRGVGLLSVRRRLGENEQTPDAILADQPVTIELKCPVASVTAMVRAARLARGQSRRVVIEIQGPRADAALALAAIGPRGPLLRLLA